MSDNASTDWTGKWSKIKDASMGSDELSLFVDIGKVPKTQRQLNLHYYYLFIRDVLENQRDIRDVLEIGCGRGTMALYLAKYLGFNISLLDDSPDAIEVAKGEFSKHGQKGKYYVRDALRTGIANESFDAVISIGLAEHFDGRGRVEELFKEQYRLLKSGGVMISLNIPRKFSVQFLNTAMRAVKKLFGKYTEELQKDYFRNALKPEEFKESAEKAGFRDAALTHVCPFPIYTPIRRSIDRRITGFNKFVLRIRSLFQAYPYKTNRIAAQAHFLVARKNGKDVRYE